MSYFLGADSPDPTNHVSCKIRMNNMAAEDLLTLYDDLAGKAWQRMADIIGVHAVMILTQRAVWMTRQKYAEAELITISDAGISFSGLKNMDPAVVKVLAEEFIVSLISILIRLLGTDIAARLAQELQDLSGLEGDRLEGS